MYLFLHVPKTAGTALRHSLSRHFEPDDLALCYGRGEIEGKLQAALEARKKLIYGHIDFSHLRAVAGWEHYRLLAFFRHPVERCISTYIHFLHARDPYRKNQAEAMGDFAGFLDSDFGHNWQCQFLAGVKNQSEWINAPDRLEQKALENLNKIHWVGRTEEYRLSLYSLQHFLGTGPVKVEKRNRSRDEDLKEELQREFSQQILAQNQSDLILWQKAGARLKEQCRQMPLLSAGGLYYHWNYLREAF